MKKWFALFGATVVAVAACGARSELRVWQYPDETGGSGGMLPDAGPDVVEEDAPPDVPPDVPPPVNDCQDAGTTYIYLITTEKVLSRFYPPDLSYATINSIDCPDVGGATPFSMAVDRAGKAYVLYNDGQLFLVSTATASCQHTDFVSNQQGFNTTFGMGFSSNADDPGETLYVTGNQPPGSTEPAPALASIDVNQPTLPLQIIGQFSSDIGNSELTGTGDARLFAFGVGPEPGGAHVAEIDKTNADVLSDAFLTNVAQSIQGWAFAFWGGDFFIFTATGDGTSTVWRYQPDTQTAVQVATLPNTIVGAGVSTCAPQAF